MHYSPYLILSVFLWAGFVSAISFMEAWLKFRAPGVTRPVGLSIGRLIFSGLNKVEWGFGVACLLLLVFGNGFSFSGSYLLLVPLLILVLQTSWLLPAMNKRAEAAIAGTTLPASSLHFYYLGMEVIKVACLIIFGMKLL